MSDRPLLFFPNPALSKKSKGSLYIPTLRMPDVSRQGQRLAPIFLNLQNAFNARRAELQQSVSGIDPEQALVIETIGGVENFANAVKKISGFEWLGEFEVDEITPDQDFYDTEDPHKTLSGRLYLIMSNQTAMSEMLSLWTQYQRDPTMKFERGLANFREVFKRLKNIRRWDVQDRLFETGIIESWRKDLAIGKDSLSVEIELWFRENPYAQASSGNSVKEQVQGAGGRVLTQAIIPEIGYHALLAELPAHAVESLVRDATNVSLAKCDSVMFFRPVGQMVVGEEPADGVVDHLTQPITSSDSSGEPIVALLDGIPLARHTLLNGRVIVDDPDNWEGQYPAVHRTHGTAMASLIVHGDLNDQDAALPRPVYARPILKPIQHLNPPWPEAVPDNVLIVDLIHRSVKRLFEGEAGTEAVAPQVKIINLSIGDPARQFTQSMSPLARLLDWLSIKFKVLFIISAGNHADSIKLNMTHGEFSPLPSDQKEALILGALFDNAWNRRILSPAESINGLTIGALHKDSSNVVVAGNRMNPFSHEIPSPISSFGAGYRRSVKPDIVFDGGKQCYNTPPMDSMPAELSVRNFRTAPGLKVAAPGDRAGDLNATSHLCGTSNAAALISRSAAICFESLVELFEANQLAGSLDDYSAILLKAMVVHGCSWGECDMDSLMNVCRSSAEPKRYEKILRRWVGYGSPQIDRVLSCTEQRATLVGFGELLDGQAHVFNLPLPPSLSANRTKRRLTTTLAWLSPVSTRSQKYRVASLWSELLGNGVGLATKRQETCAGNTGWRTVRNGTVQHEVFESEDAVPYGDDGSIALKVNCRNDAGKITAPIRYGIIVSLEVAEGLDIAIYDEIRTRIATPVQIQPTA